MAERLAQWLQTSADADASASIRLATRENRFRSDYERRRSAAQNDSEFSRQTVRTNRSLKRSPRQGRQRRTDAAEPSADRGNSRAHNRDTQTRGRPDRKQRCYRTVHCRIRTIHNGEEENSQHAECGQQRQPACNSARSHRKCFNYTLVRRFSRALASAGKLTSVHDPPRGLAQSDFQNSTSLKP